MPRRRSTAYQAAETTLKYAGWAGNRLYNWASTDHSGLGCVFDAMPHLALIDGLMHLIAQIIPSPCPACGIRGRLPSGRQLERTTK